jgi:hypothetical protein
MDRLGITEEAARLICEEQLTDYRQAKLKALERLGLPPRTALPDNASVQQAVLDWLRLFGGPEYAERLQRMRRVAVQVMRGLAPFSPRLVGGTVSGAVNAAHRVQLHVFADAAEAVDIYLLDRRIDFDQDERRYRYADGRELPVPLLRFDWQDTGVDVAVFTELDVRRAPLNPADGQAYRRLDLAAAEALLLATPVSG